jgi:hypothetical protein
MLLSLLHDPSSEEVTITLILFELFKVELVKVALELGSPWLLVPINHWYLKFVPPGGEAVNVTGMPEHIVVPGLAEMETEVGHDSAIPDVGNR